MKIKNYEILFWDIFDWHLNCEGEIEGIIIFKPFFHWRRTMSYRPVFEWSTRFGYIELRKYRNK